MSKDVQRRLRIAIVFLFAAAGPPAPLAAAASRRVSPGRPVPIEITVPDDRTGAVPFDLKRVRRSPLDLRTCGKALKSRPTAVLHGDTVIFNTSVGVAAFDLARRRMVFGLRGVRLVAERLAAAEPELVLASDLRAGRPAVLRGVAAATGKTRWSVPSPAGKVAAAAVAGSLLLVRGEALHLAALDMDDGSRVVWDRPGPGPSATAPAYDASREWGHGWRIEGHGPLFSEPASDVIVCGETVVFGLASGDLVGLRLDTGVEAWRLDTGGPANGPLASDGTTVFLGSTAGQLLAVTCRDGTVKARLKAMGDLRSLVHHAGRIYGYAHFEDAGQLFCLSAAGASVIWSARGLGECPVADFGCLFLAAGMVWKCPASLLHADRYITGWDGAGRKAVRFDKERGPDLVSPGVRTGPRGRYIKPPLLEWKGKLVLVDEKEIELYEIVPAK